MNEIVNKFFLPGEKAIPERHLKQPGFTCSACGPFIKNNERIQKFKETGDTNYIYKNELGKACFQNDIAYEAFKELARRTALDKILRDRPFNIAKNPKNDGYQRELASMDYNFFHKKPANSGVATFTNISARHKQLAEDIQKPIIRSFEKKIYSGFKNNIWGADLAYMQLINKFNRVIRFSLFVIDIFSKYAWVLPLKDKKGVTIVSVFQNNHYMIQRSCARIENQTKYGLIKEVSFTIALLVNNDIEMYSIHRTKENLLLLKDLLEP